ncbi:MAG: hypothetical protein WCT02_04365 [Candidatus Paceibacterota bacterium]
MTYGSCIDSAYGRLVSYPFLRIEYKTFLNTATWRKIRAKTIECRGSACEACGSEDKILVHHAAYSNSGWGSQVDDLIVLCEWCHEILHCKFRCSKLFDAYPLSLKQFTERFIVKQQRRLRKGSHASDLSAGSSAAMDHTCDECGLRSLIAFSTSVSFEDRQEESQIFKINFLDC